MTDREAYRLRRIVTGKDSKTTLQPIPGEDRLFETWREALLAARKLGGSDRDIVTQAVLLDAAGTVVFPPPDLSPRTRARWSVAPVLRYGPRARSRKRSGDGPKGRPAARPGADPDGGIVRADSPGRATPRRAPKDG